MIDVVLLLIIFFMLSSQFARVNAKALNLPTEPGEKTEETAPNEVIIDIDAQGAISILNQPIKDAELDAAIRSAGADTSEFLVRADKECLAERLNLVALTLIRLQVRSWKIGVAGGEGGGG